MLLAFYKVKRAMKARRKQLSRDAQDVAFASIYKPTAVEFIQCLMLD